MKNLLPILLLASGLTGCVFAELSDLPPAIATPNNEVDMSDDTSPDVGTADMEDMETECNLDPVELTSGGFNHLEVDQLGDTIFYAITSASGDIKVGRITEEVDHDILEQSISTTNVRDMAILALSEDRFLLGVVRNSGALEVYNCTLNGCVDFPVDNNAVEAVDFYRDGIPILALTYRDMGTVRYTAYPVNVESNSLNEGVALSLADLDVAGAEISTIGTQKRVVYGAPLFGFKVAQGSMGELDGTECTLADRRATTPYIARSLDDTTTFLARTTDGLMMSDCSVSAEITPRYPVDFDYIQLSSNQFFVVWSVGTLNDPVPVLRGAYVDSMEPQSFVDFGASRVANVRILRNGNGIHALFGGPDLTLRYVKTNVIALARCAQTL